jgi:hypothetical protein
MRGLMAVAALALSATALGGCAYMGDDEEAAAAEETKGAVAGTPAGGSGDNVSRTYAVSGFTGIIAAGSDKVEVVKGDAFAVSATGSAEVLDRLIIRVDDGKLEIRRRSGGPLNNSGSATIRVTMPALEDIVVAGSGDLTADSLTGDNAEIVIAGSGNVSLAAVAVRKLEMTVAGSGKVEATGTVEDVEATIAGSGDIAAPSLTAQRAEISIAGSGNIAMAVTGNADVSTIGSGDVTLTGGGTCTHNKMGGGEVNCS